MCVGPPHFIWSLRFPISVFFYAVVFTLIWVFCFVFFFCCCGFFNIYQFFFLFLTYVLFLPFRRLNSNFFRTLPVGAFTGLPSLGVLWVYLLRSCYLKHFIKHRRFVIRRSQARISLPVSGWTCGRWFRIQLLQPAVFFAQLSVFLKLAILSDQL